MMQNANAKAAMQALKYLAVMLPLLMVADSVAAKDYVEVDLYMESLCPSCKSFITGTLKEMMDGGLSPYMHLKVVPWGNASGMHKIEGSDIYTWECQHGLLECKMNLVETCVVETYTHQDQFFPFLTCIESVAPEDMEKSIESCATDAGMDYEVIVDCMNGKEAQKMQMDMGKATAGLEPPHEFVPWVVANEEPLGTNFDSLPEIVCKTLVKNGYDTLPEICDPYMPKAASLKSMAKVVKAAASATMETEVEVCMA